MSKSELLGKYLHYKGNVYVVVNIGFHTEDEERVVIYHLESDVYMDQLWVRPYDMFFGEVELADGTVVERFRKIREMDR